MSAQLLALRTLDDLTARGAGAIPMAVQAEAEAIVERVRREGASALDELSQRLGDRGPGEPMYILPDELQQALDALGDSDRLRLERIAGRIELFAKAQRSAISEVDIAVPGGRVGHTVEVARFAGCYAPGGRYPLPSSVLMTAVTARAAGVESVWVASPRPQSITLAAAALAGASGVLAAGGAHGIAAMAFGSGPIPPSEVIVGPGNQYVTAAKKYLSHEVAIDMLAGPSELLVIADGTADPAWIAADLLAQAEHDPAAFPLLVTTHSGIVARVEVELRRQLEDLPTAKVARQALQNGGALLCRTIPEIVQACERFAPEHLQLSVADPDALLASLRNYGAVFIGETSAEVLGDYGVGPNHVLPTGRTACHRGGLSVMDFLRLRSWVRLEENTLDPVLLEDAVWLARAEGLEAHARAAERRLRRCAR